jgi:hypothetical protein
MTAAEAGDVTTLNKNVVAVGGPCVNAAVRKILNLGDAPVCGTASGLTEGTAVLELKDLGTKKALLVYGWEADDTRRAAIVVKSPASFKDGLTGKTKATVRGTSLDVSGITIAAAA